MTRTELLDRIDRGCEKGRTTITDDGGTLTLGDAGDPKEVYVRSRLLIDQIAEVERLRSLIREWAEACRALDESDCDQSIGCRCKYEDRVSAAESALRMPQRRDRGRHTRNPNVARSTPVESTGLTASGSTAGEPREVYVRSRLLLDQIARAEMAEAEVARLTRAVAIRDAALGLARSTVERIQEAWKTPPGGQQAGTPDRRIPPSMCAELLRMLDLESVEWPHPTSPPSRPASTIQNFDFSEKREKSRIRGKSYGNSGNSGNYLDKTLEIKELACYHSVSTVTTCAKREQGEDRP